MADHSFIFTGPNYTVAATGVAETFGSFAQAVVANKEGAVVVGALPFHAHDNPRFFRPDDFRCCESIDEVVLAVARTPVPQVINCEALPSRAEHCLKVAQMIALINASEVDKIVLSRAERFRLAAPVKPERILAGFLSAAAKDTVAQNWADAEAHKNAHVDWVLADGAADEQSQVVSQGFGYVLELESEACGEVGEQKAFFVGPSPEVLIEKRGRVIRSFPLAGTTRRSTDPEVDQHRAQQLQHSVKNLHEHKFVTDGIKSVLSPLCSELHVPQRPVLMHTSHTWHLGTPISGVLREDVDISVLELAQLLHPTAAVNGFPERLVAEILAEIEPERGFYAGAVGFSDENGDGEFRVAIRSAYVCGSTVIARAGGGLVHNSRPSEELAETDTKLGPIRSVLGLGRNDFHDDFDPLTFDSTAVDVFIPACMKDAAVGAERKC
ncbi:chorismate-binding protein [Corynebacterium felinum]|uniref:Isochorismate synthase n=1 Tax=Corynebacterium felinum TaxID=131318 RepID=A0ABU2B8W1_9CORY|nr:chorismate-binding protein [Corynebacterium felinum]MDF5820781.1 chorismate-binding protein [Corynebacterium felinum]MDR7353824.1 isochorismate synthase [Corynebacterium felinum]WJY96001.1 Isochorismate synthase EntC [Corynebacterium felinum]